MVFGFLFCKGPRTNMLPFDCLVQFPGDKSGRLDELGQQPLDQNEVRRDQNQPPKLTMRDNKQNHRASPIPMMENNTDGDGKIDNKLIDLNARPQRIHGQNSSNQVLTLLLTILNLSLHFLNSMTSYSYTC